MGSRRFLLSTKRFTILGFFVSWGFVGFSNLGIRVKYSYMASSITSYLPWIFPFAIPFLLSGFGLYAFSFVPRFRALRVTALINGVLGVLCSWGAVILVQGIGESTDFELDPTALMAQQDAFNSSTVFHSFAWGYILILYFLDSKFLQHRRTPRFLFAIAFVLLILSLSFLGASIYRSIS